MVLNSWTVTALAAPSSYEAENILSLFSEGRKEEIEKYQLFLDPAQLMGAYYVSTQVTATLVSEKEMRYEKSDSSDMVARIQLVTDETGQAVNTEKFLKNIYKRSFKVALSGVETGPKGPVLIFQVRNELDTKTVVDPRTKEEVEASVWMMVSEKVMAGFLTKKEADEVVSYLRGYGASWKLVEDVVKSWQEPDPEFPVKKPDPLYKDPSFREGSRETCNIIKIVDLLSLSYAVILIGPKGIGKDVCAETCAWIFRQSYHEQAGNDQATDEFFTGTVMTDNSASEWLMSEEARNVRRRALEGDIDAQITWDVNVARAGSVAIVVKDSIIVTAIRKRGFYHLAEINLIKPETSAAHLNPLLAQTKRFHSREGDLDVAGTNFRFMASMNDGYAGTNDLNEALKSRMCAIQLSYPGKEAVRGIMEVSAAAQIRSQGYTEVEIPKDLLDEAAELYHRIYLNWVGAEGSLSDSALNMRGFSAAICKFMVHPDDGTLAENIRSTVIGWATDQERSTLETLLTEYIHM